MAFNYSPRVITDGLVLYLDAANTRSYPGTGTVWSDLSRGGNNGVLTNGPTFNSGNGGNIVFDGVDDRVTTNSISLTNWTIQVWFKSAPVAGQFKGIVEFALTSTGRSGLGINTNGRPLITYPTSLFNVSQGSAIDNNTWCCLTGTLNSGTPNLYVNGVLQSLSGNSSAANAITLNTIFIGDFTIVPSTLYPLNGNIASVIFYNRALSATEILQNYNTTKSRFGIL